MLELAGDAAAAGHAKDIFALETQLAKVQWTKVELRDPVKTYNKVEFPKLGRRWPPASTGTATSPTPVCEGKTDYLVIGEPSYVRGFDQLLQKTPLPVWKAYFRWRLLSDFAPYLSKAVRRRAFRVLRHGPAWNPAESAALEAGHQLGRERSIGEGLGKLYVAQYFPPESKARMDQLVKNLLAAYKRRYRHARLDDGRDQAESAGEARQVHAEDRLSDKWRDYSALQIDKRRSRRQRDPRADVRIQSQSQQAGQADRSQRVGHDAANGQCLL